MAIIKGWKKIGKERWENIDGITRVELSQNRAGWGAFAFRISKQTGRATQATTLGGRYFDTKNEAYKIAIRWMKSHQGG